MRYLLLFATFALDAVDVEFAAFQEKFHKKYATKEEAEKRAAIFKKNLKYILEENASGKNSYTLGVGIFADLTEEEFSARLNPLQLPKEIKLERAELQTARLRRKNSIDWVSEGAVNEPEDQGGCGSCWSFSTTGALEGMMFTLTGNLPRFSEQHLLDCNRDSNNGCHGGLPYRAFLWVKEHGLCSRDGYEYQCSDPQSLHCAEVCRKCQPVLQPGVVTGAKILPPHVNTFKNYLSDSVISVGIDGRNLQHYQGGIFTSCSTKLNHAVLAVGYGYDWGKPYWKLKNSWGPRWGEAGYFRIRGDANTCGILDLATVPLIAPGSAEEIVV